MKNFLLSCDISVPLCVDLDGTLIYSDMLVESVVGVSKHSIGMPFKICYWLQQGKTKLKSELAKRYSFDASSLPYNLDVLSFLKAEKARGRPIVLATATHQMLATNIAEHLGIFDQVVATDSSSNLTGQKKADILIEKFEDTGFCYIGNEARDILVAQHATEFVLVSSNDALWEKCKRELNTKPHLIRTTPLNIKVILKALRLHQWVKNLLLFVPIFMAHRVSEWTFFWHTILAFCAFCFCASAIYLTNDLYDLDADRSHPVKCKRPFASGSLSVIYAISFIPILFLVAAILGSWVSVSFLKILLAYVGISLAYTHFLKNELFLDIFILAALYTIRLIAGAVASQVVISPSLLGFSLFFFLSLALLKRYCELRRIKGDGQYKIAGRQYCVIDMSQIRGMGAASAYSATLVLALWVSSAQVQYLYTTPDLLWFICPLLLFWISRIWLLANRGEVTEDPIMFAIKDKTSYVIMALALSILFLAV